MHAMIINLRLQLIPIASISYNIQLQILVYIIYYYIYSDVTHVIHIVYCNKVGCFYYRFLIYKVSMHTMHNNIIIVCGLIIIIVIAS